MSGPLKNYGSVFAPLNDSAEDDAFTSIAVTIDNKTDILDQSMAITLSSQTNIEQVESLPPYSLTSSRMSRVSRKSFNTQTSERSSIWEASTFYSRSQTVATVYHTKSGRPFLPSLLSDCENELNLPQIETDLNVMPKDNLCVLDSGDPELDYKLVNAAVHGVAVFLRNSERYEFENRLVEILIERDYYINSSSNKEFIKFGEEEIYVSPGFKLILHVSAPILMNSGERNCNLFQRLTSQFNAAHFVLDLTPSSRYIANDFLGTIMDYEKPGYMNQINLADKILIESEFNVFNRQVGVDV